MDNEKISDSDIKYMDSLVCILHPEVKKGIIIFTHYTQPKNRLLCIKKFKW